MQLHPWSEHKGAYGDNYHHRFSPSIRCDRKISHQGVEEIQDHETSSLPMNGRLSLQESARGPNYSQSQYARQVDSLVARWSTLQLNLTGTNSESGVLSPNPSTWLVGYDISYLPTIWS